MEDPSMKWRIVYVICFLLIAIPAAFGALGATCSTAGALVPDSRLGWPQYFPASAIYYWTFAGMSGHSYSLEINAELDGYYYGGIGLTIFANYTECTHDLSTLVTTYTSYYDPSVGGNPRRSFIAPSTTTYYVKVQNGDTAGYHNLRLNLVDTTLFNTRWTTFSGFETQWGFYNTSNYTITGTLSLVDGNGNAIGSFATTLPPGKTLLRSSIPGDLNVPRNKFGSAMFAYNGPPGSISADAYYINSTATVIVPSKFETRSIEH
jgi:hypothetical protein